MFVHVRGIVVSQLLLGSSRNYVLACHVILACHVLCVRPK